MLRFERRHASLVGGCDADVAHVADHALGLRPQLLATPFRQVLQQRHRFIPDKPSPHSATPLYSSVSGRGQIHKSTSQLYRRPVVRTFGYGRTVRFGRGTVSTCLSARCRRVPGDFFSSGWPRIFSMPITSCCCTALTPKAARCAALRLVSMTYSPKFST